MTWSWRRRSPSTSGRQRVPHSTCSPHISTISNSMVPPSHAARGRAWRAPPCRSIRARAGTSSSSPAPARTREPACSACSCAPRRRWAGACSRSGCARRWSTSSGSRGGTTASSASSRRRRGAPRSRHACSVSATSSASPPKCALAARVLAISVRCAPRSRASRSCGRRSRSLARPQMFLATASWTATAPARASPRCSLPRW